MTPPISASASADSPLSDTALNHPLANVVVQALDDKKAEQITPIDVAGKCSFADVMVVASGRSARHVASLADDVVDALEDAGYDVLSVEGKDVADWVLIDAGDVVVHLFRPEVRDFYNLEKMWLAPAATGADSANYL